MYKNLLSVGFFTLLSRGTRVFPRRGARRHARRRPARRRLLVAFRLPNHFRTIFGEGAFNAAYVPSYSHVLESEGARRRARRFSSQIFTLLLASQLLLLALAWLSRRSSSICWRRAFAPIRTNSRSTVTMTRITFPYLLFITLVTLHSGTLNAHGSFRRRGFRAGPAQRRDDRLSRASLFCFPTPASRRARASPFPALLQLAC